MLHPLLVFDGDTGQLITAILHPGTYHAHRGAIAVLKRLVHHIRARFSQVAIELRADSGFAVPIVYDYCEDEHIPYTISLASNNLLAAMAASLAEEAQQQRAETGEKVRLLDEEGYRAGTWRWERRLIVKAEA